MKKCSKCNLRKEPTEFYKQGDRLASRCKICTKEDQKNSAYSKEYRDKNKEKISRKSRRVHLENIYGISESKYLELLEFQGGVCRICKQEETRIVKGKLSPLSVDHCHITGLIRGLLCNKCNNGISRFNDNPNLLIEAARYLLISEKVCNIAINKMQKDGEVVEGAIIFCRA